MKYDGFSVFKTYLAIKLHFGSDTYDYFKYDGKVNCKLETFTKRNDRYFFHKLSTKYTPTEIVNYFVSNFITNDKKWIGELTRNNGHDTYLDWKKRNDALDYHFRSDCVLLSDRISIDRISFDGLLSCNSGQHPKLLRLLLSKKIGIETALIFDRHLAFIKNWDKEIKETYVWPTFSKKLKKYRPFCKFNETKTKLIMKEIFV